MSQFSIIQSMITFDLLFPEKTESFLLEMAEAFPEYIKVEKPIPNPE